MKHEDTVGTKVVVDELVRLGVSCPELLDVGQVNLAEGVFDVEIYRRVPADDQLCSFVELGRVAAEFHGLGIPDLNTFGSVRSMRRLETSKSLLLGSSAPVRIKKDIVELLDQAQILIDAHDCRQGWVHGDIKRANLVGLGGGEWSIIDFEYTGIGPVCLDVAMTVRELQLFLDRDSVKNFLARYRKHGGHVDESCLLELSRVRDVVGVADMFSLWHLGSEQHKKAYGRLATLQDVFGRGCWKK